MATTLDGGPAALVSGGDELLGTVVVEPAEDGRAAEARWIRSCDELARRS